MSKQTIELSKNEDRVEIIRQKQNLSCILQYSEEHVGECPKCKRIGEGIFPFEMG